MSDMKKPNFKGADTEQAIIGEMMRWLHERDCAVVVWTKEELRDANQVLQGVNAAVEVLEVECYRLRAELKTSNAERDGLRQQVENIKNGFEGSCYACEPVGEMNKRLQKERDAALAVVNEFVSDTTTNNKTPDHECEFSHSPETGKCDACEAWGNYVGLFCSRTDEEETQ